MKKLILLLAVTALFSYFEMNGQSVVRLTGLQSDHLENPIGIDNSAPPVFRGRWKITGKEHDKLHTGYWLEKTRQRLSADQQICGTPGRLLPEISWFHTPVRSWNLLQNITGK